MEARKDLESGDELSEILEMVALGSTQLQRVEELAQIVKNLYFEAVKLSGPERQSNTNFMPRRITYIRLLRLRTT